VLGNAAPQNIPIYPFPLTPPRVNLGLTPVDRGSGVWAALRPSFPRRPSPSPPLMGMGGPGGQVRHGGGSGGVRRRRRRGVMRRGGEGGRSLPVHYAPHLPRSLTSVRAGDSFCAVPTTDALACRPPRRSQTLPLSQIVRPPSPDRESIQLKNNLNAKHTEGPRERDTCREVYKGAPRSLA